MYHSKAVHIFAGPSLFGTPYAVEASNSVNTGITWHPPARRGDIESLVAQSDVPGIIGLADGTFHSYPSVGHAELREALTRGWLVYGLCSMGAIRVSEMRHMGMRAFGQVADMFCNNPDVADDEVALLHATEAPYFPLSEPLVHIRAYLGTMRAQALLTNEQHVELVSVMQERWYAERTLSRLQQELARVASPHAQEALRAHLAAFEPYRLKQQDLVRFLSEQPWIQDFGAPHIPPTLAERNPRPTNPPRPSPASTATAVALSSSLRLRTAEESLVLAHPLALERGVSRVVDTTWLDRLGIPVYASIRPDAAKHSLNVHAGKGRLAAEAKIGAYMEAIEYSFAEPGRSRISPRVATPLDILNSFNHSIAFPAFCPSQHFKVSLEENTELEVVDAEELLSLHKPVLVPAELVFCPYTGPGISVYGSTMNGLASGNTVEEATVHALAEVMERDVESFVKLGAISYSVDLQTLPPAVRSMAERIEQAGMELHLRYVPNEFGLAHLRAFILEDDNSPAARAVGMGLHCNSSIAAVRAISEAAQSRLTTIHGGRDDLVKLHEYFKAIGPEQEKALKAQMHQAIADRTHTIAFDDIPDSHAQTVQTAYDALVQGLRKAGLNHVARVVLTEPSCPFQIVRVIVPGAEYYSQDTLRVGPRLLRYANAQSTPANTTNSDN